VQDIGPFQVFARFYYKYSIQVKRRNNQVIEEGTSPEKEGYVDYIPAFKQEDQKHGKTQRKQ
jgi:hypothetical protein